MGKIKDLTGQKFGKLTVLEMTNERRNRQVVWKCKCDCGNITYVVGQALRNHHTQSCGCLQKEKASSYNKKDITNQRFGKLTVLEDTKKRRNRAIIWKCKCDCGNICEVCSEDLHTGTFSCGCVNLSKGAFDICQLLNNNNIYYEREKTFNDCRFENNYHGYFDFYINNHYCIEYDGEQHFKSIPFFGGEKAFERRKKYDEYKNQYCIQHNIPLIRIPYTHLKNLKIEDLLLETSNFIYKKEE